MLHGITVGASAAVTGAPRDGPDRQSLKRSSTYIYKQSRVLTATQHLQVIRMVLLKFKVCTACQR